MKDIFKKLKAQFLVDLYHQMWPFLGATIYCRPSRNIKVIGVTGTNGKTTVVHMITEILEKAGYRVASVSSLRFKIGKKEWQNMLKMTMPGRMKLQKFLRQAVDAQCQYCVLEVTSEGIKQYRHRFIDFDAAVFTNLTPEHVERHGGFENYKKAKGELFKIAKKAIINVDDANAGYFWNLCKGRKYSYSAKSSSLHIKLSLQGQFNMHNALAAAYTGISQGIDIDIIKRALENFHGAPGRMEIVVKEPFTVIVDYAHNPDALEKVYKAIHESYKLKVKSYKFICVLGAAGGGRDKWKRPVMGKIAAKYCDKIILTDEDPYDENSASILDDIRRGILDSQFKILDCAIESDRRKAIKKALQMASLCEVSRSETKPIVIITGKGAEPLMMTKKGGIPWDDRKIVREEITKEF